MSTLLLSLIFVSSARANMFACEVHLVASYLSANPPILDHPNEDRRALPASQAARPTGADLDAAWDSDLGPTRWPSAARARDWFALAEVIRDPIRSRDTVERIIGESEYCPPGVSPNFCRYLRHLFLRDRAEFGGYLPDPEHSDPFFIISRDGSEAGKRRTINEGGLELEVPWTVNPNTGQLFGIKPEDAQYILKMMARDYLLAHLRFKDHRGDERSGEELDFQTRLAVAMRPNLSSLLPLLLVRPVDKVRGVMGQPRSEFGGAFVLLSRPIVLPDGEDYIFEVKSQNRNPLDQSISAQIRPARPWGEVKPVPYPRSLKFEREFGRLREQLEDAAVSLSSSAGITPYVAITPWSGWADFRGVDFLRVEVGGLSPLDTLLSFYLFSANVK